MKIILNLSYLIPLLALFIAQSFGQVMDSVKSGEYTIYYELKGEGDPLYIRDVLKEYLAIMVKGYLFDKSKAEEVRRISDINMEISPLMMGSLARTNWNLKDKLIEIENSRTLIIQGRQDPMDLETARQINDAINGSQLKIIEKCGHFPWIERPDEFYAILKDFLINN